MDLKHKFEKSFLFWPLIHWVGIVWMFVRFVMEGQIKYLWITLFLVYVLPVALYRALHRFTPVTEGKSYIGDRGWSPWLVGFRLQSIYIHFPFFESALKLFPPIYSAWIRLWGSQVGKRVYWSPTMEILDRGMIEVGDGVFFGHRITVISHVIVIAKNGRRLLFVEKCKFGAHSMIGAGSQFGPGTSISPGDLVPVCSNYGIRNKPV